MRLDHLSYRDLVNITTGLNLLISETIEEGRNISGLAALKSHVEDKWMNCTHEQMVETKGFSDEDD